MNRPAKRLAQPRRWLVWCGAAALVILPVLAIRGTDEGAWDWPGDLVFLGVLLAGVCGAYEWAARVPERRAYGAAALLVLAAAVLMAWMTLAVGIIGSENPAPT
jgi:peptidoglycan/LPS O-acetylase OafA/YrhL